MHFQNESNYSYAYKLLLRARHSGRFNLVYALRLFKHFSGFGKSSNSLPSLVTRQMQAIWIAIIIVNAFATW